MKNSKKKKKDQKKIKLKSASLGSNFTSCYEKRAYQIIEHFSAMLCQNVVP